MDRRGRFDPTARSDPDAAAQRRRQRAVMNDMRRKIERDARIAAAAEELSTAAEGVLTAVDGRPVDVNSAGFSALRAALARYREGEP